MNLGRIIYRTLIVLFLFVLMSCGEQSIPDYLIGQAVDIDDKLPVEGAQISVEVINKNAGMLGPQGMTKRSVWISKGATTDKQGNFKIDFSSFKQEQGITTSNGLTISELKIQKTGYNLSQVKYSGEIMIYLVKNKN
jgi:hypothetical protein